MVQQKTAKNEKKAEGWQNDPSTKERKFREVESGTFLRLETPGQMIEGTLIEKGVQQFQNGPVGRYKIEKDSGELVALLGSIALDDRMNSVPVGAFIQITFTGTTRTASNRRMKEYKVLLAE